MSRSYTSSPLWRLHGLQQGSFIPIYTCVSEAFSALEADRINTCIRFLCPPCKLNVLTSVQV
jgi:hypothetical protein